MSYDSWKLEYPPEYEQDEPEEEERCDVCGGMLADVETVVVKSEHAFCGIACRDHWFSEDEQPPEPKLRVIGYISGSRKKRATVWDNLDGTCSVVVDSKSVIVFSDVGQADSYAATYAFGRQARMG